MTVVAVVVAVVAMLAGSASGVGVATSLGRPPPLGETPHMGHASHAVLDSLPSERARRDPRVYWKRLDVAGSVSWLDGRCDLPVVEARDVRAAVARGEVPEFVAASQPVVIRGVMEEWPNADALTLESLMKAHKHDDVVVSSARGHKGTATLGQFVAYMGVNDDPNPSYVFDAPFLDAHDDVGKAYARPPGLEQNLWDDLDPELRPDLKWLLVGAPRSGTWWHTDPYNTSAWNTLVEGRKMWAFYDASVYAPPGVYGSEEPGRKVSMCDPAETWGGPQVCSTVSAFEWFTKTAPFLGAAHAPLYCDQAPGDTLWVPHGWWHIVLNLEDSVAVTENTINEWNLRDMLESMKRATVTSEPRYTSIIDAFMSVHSGAHPEWFTDEDRAFVRHYAAAREREL